MPSRVWLWLLVGSKATVKATGLCYIAQEAAGREKPRFPLALRQGGASDASEMTVGLRCGEHSPRDQSTPIPAAQSHLAMLLPKAVTAGWVSLKAES